MKCDEVQQLHGPYLDSELDAKTALEIQQHVATCPDCARMFATEGRLDAGMMAGLKQGQRTAALWEQIECRVVAAAQSAARPQPTARNPQPISWWRELFWPAPQAWAGLAAIWLVILGATFATREPSPANFARHASPPAPQMREMLKQQQQLFAELVGSEEKPEADRPKPIAPQPRSQCRNEFLNA